MKNGTLAPHFGHLNLTHRIASGMNPRSSGGILFVVENLTHRIARTLMPGRVASWLQSRNLTHRIARTLYKRGA